MDPAPKCGAGAKPEGVPHAILHVLRRVLEVEGNWGGELTGTTGLAPLMSSALGRRPPAGGFQGSRAEGPAPTLRPPRAVQVAAGEAGLE